MHGSIRERLEGLLGAERETGREGVVHDGADHLASCAACSLELQKMKAQSEMLRLLRSPQELEPAGGFYARVLQRIEERTKDSIWAAFIYSGIGTRLAYASLGIALALGSYVIAQESRDGHLQGNHMLAQNISYDVPVTGDAAQQRDAVLQNFASY